MNLIFSLFNLIERDQVMSNKLIEITGLEMVNLTANLMWNLQNGEISIEEFKKFLAMNLEERKLFFRANINEHRKIKLISSGIIIDEPIANYDFHQNFILKKRVKYFFNEKFIKFILNDEDSDQEIISMIKMSRYNFIEKISDDEVMNHFQVCKVINLITRKKILWIIESLTNKQPKGEDGALVNNGVAVIIGYISCFDGVVRNVCVRWDSWNSKWNCYCNDLDYWDVGREILVVE